MPAICLYFQVHQPYRLRQYRLFDIGKNHEYFDEQQNRNLTRRVADKCYLKANAILLDLLRGIPQFRCAFSITGTALDQLAEHAPETVDSFRELVSTGSPQDGAVRQVELLGETDCHTLASENSFSEFVEQVRIHHDRMKSLFGITPRVFRNTELVFHDAIAEAVAGMGFEAMLCEGSERILQWRSPNYVYRAASAPSLKLLLRNYRLSDDIAFRFTARSWPEFPLTAPKFASWVANCDGEVVNLFMDYETFGEHHWEDSGILNFLRHLPEEILRYPHLSFARPSEVAERCPAVGDISSDRPLSWADTERDLSAWLGNAMQQDAMRRLYSLEEKVRTLQSRDPKDSENGITRSSDGAGRQLLHDWRRLQTSDHFYYMCTKAFADGDVHQYFSPYPSPYDAFVVYNNVLNDLQRRVDRALMREHEGQRT